MTQHTQPVVANQHQQHQPQQQQTSTSQQQQQLISTTLNSSSNNNNINNNNTASATESSSPAINSNQTQTIIIQQQLHSNSNNSNNNNNHQSQQQNATGGQMFNQQIQTANAYGMPSNHHPQQHHHHQPGAMYQAMIPAAIPSNVYVNNVTANVNLHGWAHTVPHGTWVHPNGASHYIHGDLSPEQGASVIQPMSAMPVALPTPNVLAGSVLNPNATAISGGTRGSRRGRGRGGSSGSRRGDYNGQRHLPPEGSPAPQQSGQEMQQQQPDAQQMITTVPPSYLPHHQYSAHTPQYQYGYQTFFAPQQHMIHAGQSATAQQATGTPIYLSTMPVYNGPNMYHYGYYLPPVINQSDYQYGEEVGDDRQTAGEGGAVLWHQQPIYSDEYSISPGDMHGVPSEDMHHNASSIGSVNETPTMLSPNYPPLYEQMAQQMGVMQIYEDTQMGQIQVIHPQTNLPQMEEKISECGSQASTSIQMVSPLQITPSPSLALPVVTAEQIIHQQTSHLIQVTSGAIMPIDESAAPNTPPLQHTQQQASENIVDYNLQVYAENTSNIRPDDLATSLNEEIEQQPAEKLQTQYQHQALREELQLPVQNRNINLEAIQGMNNNNSKILGTVVQGIHEGNVKSCAVTAVPPAVAVNTDGTAEMATNTIESNSQQQSVCQQQQSHEKHKQQQQYVSKQTATTQHQQKYQHQQLQTSPILQQQQLDIVPKTQHYQSSTQYQQQHQQNQAHHQTYENRKSSQIYSQQHQSRSRKYEYHYGNGSSSSSNDNSSILNQQTHQAPQQQSQQATKTMSWTNSSQHKKSTNTVAVTAVPASGHTSGSYNKQSNNHATRTYTNQQHHNYHHQQQQQQNYHQQQPQTRSYGVMKMPSSPISSASNTMERKTSPSDKSQTQYSTSTASTTAAPHQFQHQHSQQTSADDIAAVTGAATVVNSTAMPAKQQSQHFATGFATKKSNFSNQGHNGAAITTHIATASKSMTNSAEIPPTPAINLAPPVSNTTPTAPSTPSWASLFANSTNAANSANTATTAIVATTATTMSNLPSTTSASVTTTTYSKKPVAKVAPYEGLTPVTPSPPTVTPGTLSYSAASAQNLSPPASSVSINTSAARKISSSDLQTPRNSLANLDEYSLKFAEYLIKYKSDWAPISLRPRGLTNRSNYCYINSILQALLGCSPLYNLIRSIPKQAANFCEVKTPTVNAMITFMSNFSTLPTGLRLRNTKSGKGNKDEMGGDLQCDPAFEPTEIYKLWNDSREEHVEGRQEDAEEFLSYILNKLNDELLEVIKLISKPKIEHNGHNETPEEEGDVWQMICNNRNKGSITRQTDFGCTPLSNIFRGELRSRLQREGEHSTDVIQPFFTLQLNIEKAASVKEALEILVGRDQLEGVTGSKTKQEVVAWQQMNLEKLPPVLILHLKWFDYRSDGCTKILKKVEFPVELKIDAKILASKKYSQKQRAYRLFAVVYHDGKEATKGHYITDVYHTGYGSWLRYDDSSVKPVSENHVLLPRAPRVPYLLCYRRCDTVPLQNNNLPPGNGNLTGNTQSASAK